MAEALLSPVLTSILDNLSSLTVRELSAAWGVEKDLENLRRTLLTTRAVLQDAEHKQWKSEAVKLWLRKLKFAAYLVGDVIDEFSTEATALKLKREKGALYQVSTLLSLPSQLLFRSRIGRKINEAKENFDTLARERQFHLVLTVEPRRKSETSSLITESIIYGRDDQKEKIIDMLQRDSRNDLLVCSICGMGGVGKTTLAQAVYNDERVKNHFDLAMWIFVSEEFDMQRLTRAILESIEGGASDIRELENLQLLLKGKLTEMKFLLILDDVWNEDMEKWNALKKLLSSGVKGSAVILTTRMQKFADAISSHTYCLESLSEDDSWSLFKQCAIGTRRSEEKYMKTFGKAMLKKCCGVPLAIKALGSLLNTKNGEDEWRLVAESEIWDLEQGVTGILSALRLSYYHLAPNLRQCFTYCCNFPKNYVMDKDNLIQLWMANEFIPARGRMDLFDIGNVIFHELVSRSFIQDVAEHEDGTTCKVHDLMHDLASSVMRGEFFSTKTMVGLENFEEVHHLCLDGTSISGQVKIPSKLKALRSLFVFTEISDSLSRGMHLRVLEMEIVSRALDDYSKLKHLRYLSFSRSKIQCLPKSIIYLQSLQTLNVKDCRRLSKLVKGMQCMKSLRYLDIRGCWDLEMPPDLLQLKSLQIWANGCVLSMDNCHDISQLRGMLFYGQLTLENLEQVSSSVSAPLANLKVQKNLRSLSLCWQDNVGDNIPLDSDEVLNSLQPHPNLKKVEIFCYQGSKFPNWFSNSHLRNLVCVSLWGCMRCERLPPLEMLSFLRELEILNMQFVKYFISECYDEKLELFPALERLLLADMPSLEAWMGRTAKPIIFPRLISLTLWGLPLSENLLGGLGNIKSLDSMRLEYCYNVISLPTRALEGLSSLRSLFIYNSVRFESLSEGVQYLTVLSELKIWDCPKLASIPDGLKKCTALMTLEIRGCPNLQRRCRKETGEDWLKIAHIPNIQFDNQRYIRNMSWSCMEYLKCRCTEGCQCRHLVPHI